ncbi:hypothetical protein VFPPC_07840 [Pochonia chlamydosporia 170]|uniref:Uncharacterized protein n=1 Tax=Pochonia chlamydosporia 170 TaxID=1380566 RepID=A0A179FML5_METCM|nr:hypothetical protein VFPPC_07840 [Pochonia chlamydosporia 170]OAQ66269.1 hypothetical protein VFPPC_07840 [Pochonia chlamydosporia 170]
MAEQRLERLLSLRNSAIRYSSPEGVALAATQIRLPPSPSRPKAHEGQTVKLDKEHKFPWLEDLELIKQWEDERPYMLHDTWFAMLGDGNDQSDLADALPTCSEGTALATSMYGMMEKSLQKDVVPNFLAPFQDTFCGKLEALVEHFDEGCCKANLDPDTTLRHSHRGILLSSGHIIDEAHLQQLMNEMKRLKRYCRRMTDEVNRRRDAQKLSKNRWGNRVRRGGKVSVMKSKGLGSLLRESCDLDLDELPADSWESWAPTDKPSRVVLVQPEQGGTLGNDGQLLGHREGQAEDKLKLQNRNRIRW